jgi:hypothetical protein
MPAMLNEHLTDEPMYEMMLHQLGMKGPTQMMKRGAGLLPLLHKNTSAKLRAAYRATWGQEWPHDDRYLKKLWDVAGEETDRQNDRHSIVQNAMRECDDTIPAEYGRV